MADRYWINGTGNWSAINTANWSATSGGTGGASVPTAADNVFFDGNSNLGTGAFTVTVTAAANCLDLNISNTVLGTALDGVMNLAGTLNINVAGSLYTPPSPSTNFARTSYTGIITFTSTTTGRTITGFGGSGGQAYTFNGVGGGWTLQNDFSVGPIILTAGTISLGTYTLATNSFASSNSNTRAINFGTGVIQVTGAGTAWDTATVTGFSYTGTPTVNMTNGSAVATTVSPGAMTEAQALNFNFTAGTYSLTLSAGSVNNLNFNGFSGTWAAAAATTIYGNLTISTGMTVAASLNAVTFASTSTGKTITTSGKTLDLPITFNGVGGSWILQDALTAGSTNTRTCTLTAGTLDLNSKTLTTSAFSSTNSNTRAILFGTLGQITLTGGSGTIWNTSTTTGFSYTGSGNIVWTYAGANNSTINMGTMSASQALNLRIVGGTFPLTLSGGGAFLNLDFGGFSGTYAQAATSISVYGNLTFSPTMVTSTSSGTLSMIATSGTKTITTSGAVLTTSININGAGGTFQLIDNFAQSDTASFTLTAGTLSLVSNTLTVGRFISSGSGIRTLDMGTNTTMTVIGSGATVWNTATLTNLTLSPIVAPTILLTYSGSVGTRTINSGSTRAGTNAFSFKITAGSDVVTFTASNTFYNLDFTGFSGTWSNIAVSMYGNLLLSSTMTVGAGTGTLSYLFSGASRTITSNGKTLDFPINLSLSTTAPSLIFADTFTQGSTRAFTLTTGTLNVNSQTANVGLLTILTGDSIISNGTLNCASVTHTSGTITVGTGTITSAGAYNFTAGTITINNSATITTDTFTSSGAAVRVIAFGTGQINLTGNTSTVWNLLGPSNFSYSGLPKVNLTYSGSAGSRTIAGGTAGESAAINFNVVAGSDTIIFGGQLKNVNLTGFAGTFYTSGAITIFGNITIPSGLVGTSTTGTLTLGGTTGTQILDVNGSIIKCPITIANAATRLDSAFNQQDYPFNLTSGDLDLNGKTLTTPLITVSAGTKSIIFNSGTIVLTNTSGNVFNNTAPTGFTTSAGTGVGTISVVSSGVTAKTFAGGGSTFAAKLNQGGLGTLNITGSNTFDDITNTVQPTSVLFTAGTTTTVNKFSLSGTAGNLITIGSIGGAANHTLSKTSGTVTVSNCTISQSTATGGATWQAPTTLGNVDGGNNTGWSFGAIVTAVAAGVRNFFSFF